MPRKIADIRREEIVEALGSVLQREGLAIPSYDSIASAGGMSRQLVRHYYRDAEEMAVHLCERLAADFHAAIAPNGSSDRASATLSAAFGLSSNGPDPVPARTALAAMAFGSQRIAEALSAYYALLREHLIATVSELRAPSACEKDVSADVDMVLLMVAGVDREGSDRARARDVASRLLGFGS